MTKEAEKLVIETREQLRRQRMARRPLISFWNFLSLIFGLILIAMLFGFGLGIGIILGAGALVIGGILNTRHRRRMARLANHRELKWGFPE